MSEQTLSVNFSLPSRGDEEDYILIEQEPWPKDVGKTTVLQGLAGMSAMLFNTPFPPVNCGGDAEGYDTDIYVYPSRIGLIFSFYIFNGTYTPKIAPTSFRDEMKQCGLVDSIELDYPPLAMPSLQWIGDCYDERGAITSKPIITVIGRTISFSKKVYGSFRARYSVYRKVYSVRVESRDDSIENNFEGIAYCVWNGGVAWEKCKPPSGYDVTGDDCGNGINSDGSFGAHPGDLGSVEGDEGTPSEAEDNEPLVAEAADLEIKVRYCEQTELSRILRRNS